MIDRAIATAKEIQSKQETFQEQKKAVIEDIKNMESETVEEPEESNEIVSDKE